MQFLPEKQKSFKFIKSWLTKLVDSTSQKKENCIQCTEFKFVLRTHRMSTKVNMLANNKSLKEYQNLHSFRSCSLTGKKWNDT